MYLRHLVIKTVIGNKSLLKVRKEEEEKSQYRSIHLIILRIYISNVLNDIKTFNANFGQKHRLSCLNPTRLLVIHFENLITFLAQYVYKIHLKIQSSLFVNLAILFLLLMITWKLMLNLIACQKVLHDVKVFKLRTEQKVFYNIYFIGESDSPKNIGKQV